MRLDEVVDELYGLPPDRFVGARNARAKELGASGERQAAGEVRKLPKPSAAAWAANVVVRTDRRTVEALLDLGEQLRRAQRQARGADIRNLSARRRELVQRLVVTAVERAEASGQPLGSQARRQLEETFEAAVADDTAATALRAGRLSDAMTHVGFGDVTVVDRPAAGDGQRRARGVRASTGRPVRKRGGGGTAADRSRATANEDVAQARAGLQAADAALGEARRRHRDALVAQREAAKAVRAAEGQLARAAGAVGKAEQARKRAKDELDAARAGGTRRS